MFRTLHWFRFVDSYVILSAISFTKIVLVLPFPDAKNNKFAATDIATIKNDKLYVIQYYYYAKLPKQQAYFQTLQKMVDSFQIIK